MNPAANCLDPDTLTHGHLLGGRVTHAQFRHGHRTGIEPVLLAGAIPARPGQSVLEAGCGSGAGLLCLATRVAGLTGTGIEIDPTLASIARANVVANGLADINILDSDLADFDSAAQFDHAFANPPWHHPDGTASPDVRRERGKRAGETTFRDWAHKLARALRTRGTLTFVVAASVLSDCITAFEAAGCGSLSLFPLWPRAGTAAKLVILQGVRAGRGPTRLLPGLILHESDGSFTTAADAVLRRGEALRFG
jgi:tRNA1(Val) A37 N6-methylase TrmN6